jgi:hypothetical protein
MGDMSKQRGPSGLFGVERVAQPLGIAVVPVGKAPSRR